MWHKITCSHKRYLILKYPAEVVGQSLSKERLGGTCMFNICASGETLIPHEIVDYTKAILQQGHYVMIVTNGMLKKRFEEFAGFPEEYRKRLFLSCRSIIWN